MCVIITVQVEQRVDVFVHYHEHVRARQPIGGFACRQTQLLRLRGSSHAASSRFSLTRVT